jgi:hypothetical protein
MPGSRRFPPPWSIAENNDACFIVRDHKGQALASRLVGSLALIDHFVGADQ